MCLNISHRDLDNGTLFRTRGGGTACITKFRNDDCQHYDYPWAVAFMEQSQPGMSWVTEDGRFVSDTWDSEFDLLDRVGEVEHLDPPITQADVDNGTVFKTRDGRTTTLTSRSVPRWKWAAKLDNDTIITFDDNGRWAPDGQPHNFDLISRQPTKYLEFPITQADVDHGTVFNTRGGITATVLARRNDVDESGYPWQVQYRGLPRGVSLHPVVTSSGAYRLTFPTPHDLVSRVPASTAFTKYRLNITPGATNQSTLILQPKSRMHEANLATLQASAKQHCHGFDNVVVIPHDVNAHIWANDTLHTLGA